MLMTITDHEQLHETYSDLMECIYPHINTNMEFAIALSDLLNESSIEVQLEQIRALCKQFNIPCDTKG